MIASWFTPLFAKFFLLKLLMALTSATDVTASVHGLQCGAYEANPVMRPFSHGGAPTMIIGVSLNALFADYWARTRHGDNAERTALEVGIASHVLGTIVSNQTAKTTCAWDLTPGQR